MSFFYRHEVRLRRVGCDEVVREIRTWPFTLAGCGTPGGVQGGGISRPRKIQVRGEGLNKLWEKALDRKGKVKNHPAAIGGPAVQTRILARRSIRSFDGWP